MENLNEQPKGWDKSSAKKAIKSMKKDTEKKDPFDACEDKMKDKVDDTGAFCASVMDKAKGKGWREKNESFHQRLGDIFKV